MKGVAVASGKYIAPGRREEGGDRRGESMSMRRGFWNITGLDIHV